MKTHPREILILYNSESSNDKKVLAYAQSTGFKIRSFCHSKSPYSSTAWKSVLHALGMHPKEIMNKADPYYQSNIRGREFDDEGWLSVILNNPQLIKSPIAVKGKKAMLCRTPSDIYRL